MDCQRCSCFYLVLIIIVSSIFSSNVIQQNDFTLNQSWLHISQVDRQKSSDQVEYYTDIDSILLYMNFRYGGDWEPDANWDDGTGGKLTGALGFNHFSDALDDIWKEENNDIDNLKTMAELYTNGKAWIKLDKDDLADYKEILESQSETGKYLATQELINPFFRQMMLRVIQITLRFLSDMDIRLKIKSIQQPHFKLSQVKSFMQSWMVRLPLQQKI